MYIRILFLLVLLLCGSCGSQPSISKDQKGKQPTVVLVSLAPYQFLVEQIGGESVKTQILIPQNANPHNFEPTSKQIAQIAKADIWFCIGEPFEKKLFPLLKQKNPHLIICDLRHDIELLSIEGSCSCAHDSFDSLDRHIWLSPRLAEQQAAVIAHILSEYLVSEAIQIQNRLDCLRAEFKQLDEELTVLLKPLQGQAFVVSHPAFGYFCRDYQMRQLSIEDAGKEPRPRHLEKMMEKAIQMQARVAFALPQHNNKGAYLIAERLQIPLRTIDPYGSNYFEMMRFLARCIVYPNESE